MPASIKEIKWHAFVASKISILKIDAVKPPLLLVEDDPFMQDGLTLIVPVGSKSLYEKAPVWSLYDIREVGLCFIKVKNNGGGSVKIGEKTIQSGEVSVAEATDVQVSFIPDEGYSLKQVKLGAIDVTEQVKGNTLTIPKIVENKELTVVFEKEVYSVKVSYNEGGVVDVNKQDVTSGSSVLVDAGTDVKLGITPNEGFKLQQVLLGTNDVTKQVENGVLTISKISESKDVIVRFERIETVASYTVKVTHNEGGTVQIGEEAISSGSSKVVTASEDITVSIIPKTGYHVKSVQLNKKDVTDKIENNKIVITSINADQELAVIFEKGTPGTCSVKVSYSDGGMVKVNNYFIDNGISLMVQKSAKVSVAFIPDYGCYLKQVLLDGKDVTLKVVDDLLVVESVTNDLAIVAIFEKTPLVSCIVDVIGNGAVKVNGQTIRQSLETVSVEKGSAVTLSFTPDAKYKLGSVLLNNQNVIGQLMNNEYHIASLTSNLTCQVEFVLKDAPTGIDQPENATKRVYRSASRRLAIFGFEAGVPVYVYDGTGRLVVLKTIRDSMEEVEVPADGLYFVRIGKESFKVIL